MPKVAIEQGHTDDLHSLNRWLRESAERVSRRAYDLFQSRGGSHGADQDDWFQAERELLWIPESELAEKDGGFEIQLSVPGFRAKDLAVTALPHAVVVRAQAAHQTGAGNSGFEIAERSFYRRFDLACSIDAGHVTANLTKGVLRVSAPKAKSKARPLIAVP